MADVAQAYGVSEQTIYPWRKRFGGLEKADVRKLRELEKENARLKRMLAERRLSQRRSCALLGLSRSRLRYVPIMDGKDAPAMEAMRRLAALYPRYGYRRIRIFLAREGFVMGGDRCNRLWCKAGLHVPVKRPRRRIAASRSRPEAPTDMGHVWAYDFVHGTCARGEAIKCLTVVNEYTRECLAIDVGRSIRSERVIQVLSRLASVHGAPRFMRSDNGPEFESTAFLRWISESGISTAHIDPGKPWQNCTNESFNGKFRDECLSMECFRSRAEARVLIEAWRQHYNTVRPHFSLGGLTPAEFKDTVTASPNHDRAIP